MRHTIDIGQPQLDIHIRITEDSDTWDLKWSGVLHANQARRMPKAAEIAILQNDGEYMRLTCTADQHAVRKDLDRWPARLVVREGGQYTLQLIYPGDDGFIHEDYDFRTPLRKITCPTCVDNIAKKRTRTREDAFGKDSGPKEIAKHSRLIAEAYTRLAEIEENLKVG